MIWIIILLGLLLRVISLNQSFWLDEATSATVARDMGFGEIITKFSAGDFHPPLYYLILKAWTIPFGVNEISVRFLSILAALGTIFIVYKIGKEILGKSGAIMAGILLSSAPLHIYYSQEARMYALETFFVSLSVYLYLKVSKKANLLYWLAFSASLILVGATDYLPLLIIPVFWLDAFLARKKAVWWGKFFLSHLPFVGMAVIWFPLFIKQLLGGLSVKTGSSGWWSILGKSGIKEAILLPTKFLLGRISFTNKFAYFVAVVVAASVNLAVIIKGAKEARKHLVIWLWLILPVLASFILGFWLPVFSYFRLIFVLPALYLVIAIGLTKIKESTFPIVFLALIALNICFSLVYLLNPAFHREDWRGLVSYVKTESKGKSATIFVADSQKEAYRFYGGEPLDRNELDATYDTVWLMRYVQNVFDPADATRDMIENLGYTKVSEHNFSGVVVWKYENRN